MAKITYYDLNAVNWTSFFINGFIENAKEHGYQFAVSKKVPVELRDIEMNIEVDWLNSNRSALSMWRYEDARQSFLFCIDAGDRNGEESEIDNADQLLAHCKHYFKVNYNEEAITNHPLLASYADKIVPIPVVYALAPHKWWRFLPKITPIGGGHWPYSKFKQRLRRLQQYISLDEFRSLRSIDNDVDVFFVSTYYDGAQHDKENNERLTIVRELHKHKNLNLVVGFAAAAREIPGEYAQYKVPFMSYGQYLNLMARSRIGLYVRGTFGCLSFKFGEQMALGKPIVGETILNNRSNMYAYNYFNEQFAYDDPYEMVDRILTLLNQPKKMDELRMANTDTFEHYLTPKPVIAAMLDHLRSD